MKRAILALPLISLGLHADILCPEPRPAVSATHVVDLASVYPALPPRNEGRLGKKGDPLNMIFLGSEERVRAALEGAGWTPIPLNLPESLRAGLGELLRRRPLTRFPPMNTYRVQGRTQDMNWAIVIIPIQTRHHFRLWRTGIIGPRGREVWWGTGNYDLSVRWWDLSHVPDPDMNYERDYIAETLAGSPQVESLAYVDIPQVPRSGANDKGYPFHQDGRALLVSLKPETP